VVEPALPNFLSMQPDPHETGRTVPAESRWAVNWKPVLSGSGGLR